MMPKDSMEKGMMCKCPHHKVIPGMITLIGLAFLLQGMNLLKPEIVNIAWPILVIIGGLTKLNEGKCTCC